MHHLPSHHLLYHHAEDHLKSFVLKRPTKRCLTKMAKHRLLTTMLWPLDLMVSCHLNEGTAMVKSKQYQLAIVTAITLTQ
jgi:hypothetical protein